MIANNAMRLDAITLFLSELMINVNYHIDIFRERMTNATVSILYPVDDCQLEPGFSGPRKTELKKSFSYFCFAHFLILGYLFIV